MIAVCLALAIDVSGSVSDENFALQAQGTAAALEQPAVIRAARDGLAASVIYFGSRATLVVPPMPPTQAAAALRTVERRESGATNVAAAIRLAAETLAAQDCERRVLDISGDGHHNSGPLDEVTEAVADAVASGVEINALPVVTQQEPHIAEWFREHVTAPSGGFVIAAEWTGFARAIRHKLSAEVAAR